MFHYFLSLKIIALLHHLFMTIFNCSIIVESTFWQTIYWIFGLLILDHLIARSFESYSSRCLFNFFEWVIIVVLTDWNRIGNAKCLRSKNVNENISWVRLYYQEIYRSLCKNRDLTIASINHPFAHLTSLFRLFNHG